MDRLKPHLQKPPPRPASSFRKKVDPPGQSAAAVANNAHTRELWRAAALAIGRYLEQNGNIERPIRMLTIEELEGMAVVCVDAYQKFRESWTNAPPARDFYDDEIPF
jgi:hypothetical protein